MTIQRAPSRPTTTTSSANIRTTGRDFLLTSTLVLLTWFPFLYSNSFGGGGLDGRPHATQQQQQLSVNGRRMSLLCWRAGRRGRCLSVTGFVPLLFETSVKVQGRDELGLLLADCWVLVPALKFCQLQEKWLYVSIWSVLTSAAGTRINIIFLCEWRWFYPDEQT